MTLQPDPLQNMHEDMAQKAFQDKMRLRTSLMGEAVELLRKITKIEPLFTNGYGQDVCVWCYSSEHWDGCPYIKAKTLIDQWDNSGTQGLTNAGEK